MEKVNAAAAAAISERGHFAIAIPGGSVLKMLKDTAPEWAAKSTLAYVNHKAVAMDDIELATHAKASKLFLDGWKGCDAIVMGGTADAGAEAAAYQAKLEALPKDRLPRTADGLPMFDMMLVGVGDDGHVGSLYPQRDEVLETKPWVLPVEMKVPGSISLSLPVMAAAKEVVIAACGVSDKYPQGKSDAMRRAIEGEESLQSFPAAGLRPVATWVLDEAAASKLSATYKA
jgi:6-phosphogluconolactonase|eukprot:Transcript_19580.p1 GENE.Transcript_19580~~Transcript_19580.p1  ORF type:complete len:230 (-),score=94.04 Transcript_19580:95-784(-)